MLRAGLAHLYVFGGAEGILVEQRPEREHWATIEHGWEAFMRFIAEDLPPPLTERDTVIRTDREWELAAAAYVQFKSEAELAAARLDDAKAQLVVHMDALSMFEKQGLQSVAGKPEELAALVAAEVPRWAKVIQAAKIPLQ